MSTLHLPLAHTLQPPAPPPHWPGYAPAGANGVGHGGGANYQPANEKPRNREREPGYNYVKADKIVEMKKNKF